MMKKSVFLRLNNVKHPKLQIPCLVRQTNDTNQQKNNQSNIPNNNFTVHVPESSIKHSRVSHGSKSVLSSLNDNSVHPDVIKNAHLVSFDIDMDTFLTLSTQMNFVQAIEKFFSEKYGGNCVFWYDIPSLQTMYSNTYRVVCKRDVGIAGAAYVSRRVVKADILGNDKHYNKETDSLLGDQNCSVISFPVFSLKNSIIGVVEVSKPKDVFNDVDVSFVEYFARKFRLYSEWFLTPQVNDTLLLDIMQLLSLEQFTSVVRSRLCHMFDCKTAEVWRMNKTTKETIVVSDGVKKVEPDMGGIAYDVLTNARTLNCQINKLHACYNANIDGEDSEAVLAVPVIQSQGDHNYVVVLRGPRDGILFSNQDEINLKKIAPYIAIAFSNSDGYSNFFDEIEKSKFEQEGLTALLEVAEVLSSQLDIERLVQTIMEKGRALTNADRCSLFLVNGTGDRLITSFHKGLDNSIDIPINKGIAGYSATNKRIVNIANAYDDPNFDSTSDVENNYKTQTLLCVPIYNYRGEVTGVTEMVNKLDNKPFTQWDAKVIQIFNVFCGISLENAKLYNESTAMSLQLQSFFDVSITMSKAEDVKNQLATIMRNARQASGAERFSIFLIDTVKKCLSSFLSDGGEVPPILPLNTGIAASCAQTAQSIIVNDAYHDPRFYREIDARSGFKTRSVICAPLLISDGSCIGVAQLVNKKEGDFTESNMKMLQSFASFASMALEKSKLQTIAEYGEAEFEMMKCIGESEKGLCDVIPSALRLSEEQEKEMRQLSFMARQWNENDRMKLLYSLFYEFGIMQEYEISNEMLFKFLFELRSTYNNVPYHNWIHACDVAQYVTYQIRTSQLTNILSKFELFGILIAAICHDADHEGFNNIYNVKAETPLGILFKDQSVMEIHHCTVAIRLLTKDNTNLFHKLSLNEQKKMWQFIFKLILATDMGFHFKMVKQANEILDQGPWNMDDPEQRILALQLILKVGDISNVSRPFKIADEWCDVLCDEFWRQGDNEKDQGFGLTSPLNDREHPDKPKSQIGFYNFVCIPLYQVVSRIFPHLEVNLDSVKSNLEVWMSMVPPPPQDEVKNESKPDVKKEESKLNEDKEQTKTEEENEGSKTE